MKFSVKSKIILFFFSILLPAGCRQLNTGRVSIIFAADKIDLSYSLPAREILENIRDELDKKEYVKTVKIEGLPEEILEIDLNKERIEALDLDYDDVVREMEVQLQGTTPEELEKVRIKNKKGNLIPLAAIAAVKLRSEQHDVFYHGERVYKIRIEYHKDKFGELADDLQKLSGTSQWKLIVDCNDL